MGFIAPLVLLGLGALAVPIVVHLIQRERKRVVEFPSLMFLRKIPYQSVRRRRIRDWLLLAMRLAALALIVLAFARPFFKRSELAAAAQNGAREAVILVDVSYSMEYGDRWQKAKAAATDAIRGLNPGDRASLVFFSSGAEVAVRSAADRGRLESGLAAANTGPGATRYAPALKLAGSLPGDALKRDNVFHFVVSPSEPVHAVVLSRGGAEREAMFLGRALAIGEAPRVEMLPRTPTTVTDADLRQAGVVLLIDVQVPDELADRLSRFVAGGGGVLFAAGPHA